MTDHEGKVIWMSENETKRVRRTPEERIAEIDAKIRAVSQSIEDKLTLLICIMWEMNLTR